MRSNRSFQLVSAALFAALIFVGTQFLRIPLPFGYFNLGDCFVLLGAVMIGGPYAAMAAAVGAGLADCLSGYVVYAPATMVIKPVMTAAMFLAVKLADRKSRNLSALLLAAGALTAETIMVCGYFLYDLCLYQLAGALAALPGNLMQGAVAVVISLFATAVVRHNGRWKQIMP